MLEQVTISAPSRLHFGLFSIGDLVTQKFGGIGLMIDSPRTIITAKRNDNFQISEGPASNACQTAIEHWFSHSQMLLRTELSIERLEDLPVRIEIDSIPPRHSGYGSGTQLAFSSVMAIIGLCELNVPSPIELASSIGRGKRSGIGSHGFFQGGFLVDRGKSSEESLAPLDYQTDFPEPWTIVTVILVDVAGLSGSQEHDAFADLPGTSESSRDEMIEIVRGRIIPGVLQREFENFSEGVYEFGRQSGMMFARVQNGPYNGPQIEALIEQIRDFGVKGVGQSSWGPCVFSICRNDSEAQRLADFLKAQHGDRCQIQIAKADNSGARFICDNSAELA